MTKYNFKVNDKIITIEKHDKHTKSTSKSTRRPNCPDKSREHLEWTMAKWCMLDKPSPQQRISMRAWVLQKQAGHESGRVACGQGRYKVTLYLPHLIRAYNELY